MKIWIIGGTTDSGYLVQAIISGAFANNDFANCSFDYVVTVTTPEAQNLYSDKQKVVIGIMNREQMKQFCHLHEIAIIVDASHPFATEVSQNAIAISQNLRLPYLRYERKELSANNLEQENNNQNISLDSFDELLEGNYLSNHRVLLTVGCKVLPQFKSWHNRTTLFARILPKLNSLKIALDSGFTSDRIIALRPPYSKDLEVALWQQWQISLVVTKASGKAGGEDLKQKVANSLNIPLITITRPKLVYPQVTTKISEVITFLETMSSSINLNT